MIIESIFPGVTGICIIFMSASKLINQNANLDQNHPHNNHRFVLVQICALCVFVVRPLSLPDTIQHPHADAPTSLCGFCLPASHSSTNTTGSLIKWSRSLACGQTHRTASAHTRKNRARQHRQRKQQYRNPRPRMSYLHAPRWGKTFTCKRVCMLRVYLCPL